MTIYSAGRDVMRMRNADWHEKYTLPSLWDFYQPNRNAHGAYWFYWTTEDEIQWKRFYQVWMSFLNDFKNAGGRVTTGSDPASSIRPTASATSTNSRCCRKRASIRSR